MVADKDIYAVNIYPELQHFSAFHFMYFRAVLAELQFLIPNIRSYTSVTHLDQAISLDIFVKTCMVLGPPVIYFFALGRKYITVLDEKCLTMNILTGNIWADILC